MTPALALLENLRAAGITLELDAAGRVLASPAAQLLPPWREALARHQARLAELLRQEAPPEAARPCRRPRERWVFTIEPLPGKVPGVHRVRSALKVLLRSFGLRCVAVVEAPPEPGKETT